MGKLSLVVLLSFFTILFSSCNQEDPNAVGRLSIKVKYDNAILQNAMTGIATSKKNLDAGIYVKSGQTDKDGNILFNFLAPGTYFYDSYYYMDNNKIYLYAYNSIQILPASDNSVTLELIREK